MLVEFDPAKDAANIKKHGLSLGAFKGFEAEPAVMRDERFDYGETRYRAFGRMAGLGYCLVFALRRNVLRAISFRRAHEKEMAKHEKAAPT